MSDMGRPPIKTEDFKPDWKDRILSLAKEGASIVELSVELDISRETLYQLIKRDKDFADTIKRCKSLSEKWWEEQGRTNLRNKDFSYVGWYMNMKNRFGWRDRQDVTSNDKALPTPILGGLSKDSDNPDEE